MIAAIRIRDKRIPPASSIQYFQQAVVETSADAGMQGRYHAPLSAAWDGDWTVCCSSITPRRTRACP